MQISAFPVDIITLQQLHILDLSQNSLQTIPEVLSLSLYTYIYVYISACAFIRRAFVDVTSFLHLCLDIVFNILDVFFINALMIGIFSIFFM